LLAIVIAPAAILVAWICNRELSASTLLGAAIGGGVSWLAGAIALTATALGNRLKFPVQSVLIAMLIRMGLPLAAIIALPYIDSSPAAKIARSTILGVYLIALVIETALSLRMIPQQAHAAKAA
jgi:hypothetical protein